MSIVFVSPTVVSSRRRAMDSSGLWGYTNSAYTLVIPCAYHQAFDFQASVSLAKVYLNGRYGILNTAGQMLASCVYDSITDYVNGVALAFRNGARVRLNTQGREF